MVFLSGVLSIRINEGADDLLKMGIAIAAVVISLGLYLTLSRRKDDANRKNE